MALYVSLFLSRAITDTITPRLNARQRLRNSHSGGAHSIPLESEGYHNLDCVAMPVGHLALFAPHNLFLSQSFVIEISPGNEGNTATVSSLSTVVLGTDEGVL